MSFSRGQALVHWTVGTWGWSFACLRHLRKPGKRRHRMSGTAASWAAGRLKAAAGNSDQLPCLPSSNSTHNIRHISIFLTICYLLILINNLSGSYHTCDFLGKLEVNTALGQTGDASLSGLTSQSITYLLQNFCVLSQYKEFLMSSDWPFLLRTPWRLCPWKHILSVSSSVQLN